MFNFTAHSNTQGRYAFEIIQFERKKKKKKKSATQF